MTKVVRRFRSGAMCALVVFLLVVAASAHLAGRASAAPAASTPRKTLSPHAANSSKPAYETPGATPPESAGAREPARVPAEPRTAVATARPAQSDPYEPQAEDAPLPGLREEFLGLVGRWWWVALAAIIAVPFLLIAFNFMQALIDYINTGERSPRRLSLWAPFYTASEYAQLADTCRALRQKSVSEPVRTRSSSVIEPQRDPGVGANNRLIEDLKFAVSERDNQIKQLVGERDSLQQNIKSLHSETDRLDQYRRAIQQTLDERTNEHDETRRLLERASLENRDLRKQGQDLTVALKKSAEAVRAVLGSALAARVDQLQLEIIPVVAENRGVSPEVRDRIARLARQVVVTRRFAAGIDLAFWRKELNGPGSRATDLLASIEALGEIDKLVDNKQGNLFGSGSVGSRYEMPDPTASDFVDRVTEGRLKPLFSVLGESVRRAATMSGDLSVVESQVRSMLLRDVFSRFFVAQLETLERDSGRIPLGTADRVRKLAQDVEALLAELFSLSPQRIRLNQSFAPTDFVMARSLSASDAPQIVENGIAGVQLWGYCKLGSSQIEEKAEVLVRTPSA